MDDKVSPLEAALDKIHTVAASLREESMRLNGLIGAASALGMDKIADRLKALADTMAIQADGLSEASGDVVAYTLHHAEASSANVLRAALAGVELANSDGKP